MTLLQPNSKPQSWWLPLIQLLRWDKPAGRLILMIPALWAVFLAAGGTPPLFLVGIIVAGTLATSAAGCVVNDLWDRNIDPHVQRTRDRPLASRALSIQVGLGVALVALVCAWGLSRFLNPLSFGLCVAAVPVILFYPLAKRVFPIPQLVLSLAWGFAVLISWSAVTARLEPATWLLWGATVLWTLGFDTVYAMADQEDDRRLGIHSSALFFGRYAADAVGLCFAGTAMLLAGLGVLLHLQGIFALTLGISLMLWGQQYAQLRRRKPPASAYSLRRNVVIGFILLGGMIAGSLL